MDKGERVERFLAWARDSGVPAARLEQFQPIAQAFVERAGNARVNESHVLFVSDRASMQQGPDAAAAVHECGDLFLRFEEVLRVGIGGAGTIVRPAPAAASALPRRPVPPPPEPRRPSEVPNPLDAPEPLRPPERASSADPVADEAAVTFRPPVKLPGEPPRAPAAPAAATPIAAPRAAPAKGRRAAVAQQFRCPRCHVMVTPDPKGVCPRCGASPPHALSIPDDEAPPPPALAARAGRRWLGPAVVGALIAAVLAGLVVRQIRGRGLRGEVSLAPIGLEVTFTRPWHRAPEGDQEQSQGGVRVRLLAFYRGGSFDDPTVALLLGVADGQLPDLSGHVSDLEFRRALGSLVAVGMLNAGGAAKMDPKDCQLLQLGMRRTGRCTGTIVVRGTLNLAAYVWFEGHSVAFAFFFSKESPDAMLAEADELVGSIDEMPTVAGGK
jgi:hypothetical protein